MRIADIPPEFLLRAQQTAQYPPHQNSQPLIEERALNYFKVNNINSDYIYLPIQWTEYLCNHNWGNDPQAVSRLQEVCDQITSQYPNEKFFTIVQFDGGTLTKINNCTIFSASGDFNSPKGENSPYIPIPLLCNPHQGEPRSAKNYKLGFAGRSNTHPLRERILSQLSPSSDYRIELNHTSNLTQIMQEVLYDSTFALAPRGFGPASFRMYESMQMGCIPIYISDEFWLPFEDVIDWPRAALLLREEEMGNLSKVINDLIETGASREMEIYGQECYSKYLTWQGCINRITSYLQN